VYAELAISFASAKFGFMSLEFIKPQLATAVDIPLPVQAGFMKSSMTDTARS
jgi:hypothetical protein